MVINHNCSHRRGECNCYGSPYELVNFIVNHGFKAELTSDIKIRTETELYRDGKFEKLEVTHLPATASAVLRHLGY